MCPFVEKKKKKALCLVLHISTKKRPTLFFQPLPTPLLLIIITYCPIVRDSRVMIGFDVISISEGKNC